MLISLALLPNHGRSATPASQARVDGVILTSQNRSTWSTYMDIHIFLIQKNTKNVTISLFIRYNYADAVPLMLTITRFKEIQVSASILEDSINTKFCLDLTWRQAGYLAVVRIT